MAATLTGIPTAITWASGINPAGQSITIPSDATAVYMFWTYWANSLSQGLASVTLGGSNPNQTHERPISEWQAGSGPVVAATGVAAWYNPTTGSRTLDPAWDIATAEGATTIVAYVTGGDTAAWRDVDSFGHIDANAVSVTLTTVSGDLVIKYNQRYIGDVGQGTNPPSLSAGWSDGQVTSNNNEGARLSTISATGTSTVCASTDSWYSTVLGISIPAAPADNSSASNWYYRALNG